MPIALLLILNFVLPQVLFHTFIELTGAVLAVIAASFGFQSYRFTRDKILLFISFGLFFIGIFDGFHAIFFIGMRSIPIGPQDISLQFWIAGRILQILIFSFFPVVLKNNLSISYQVFFYVILVTLLFAAILFDYFPSCYNQEAGFTDFFMIVELALSGIAIVSLFFLNKLFLTLSIGTKFLIAVYLLLLAISGLFFVISTNEMSQFYILGHIFEFYGMLIVWVLIVTKGLGNPFNHMFKEIFNEAIHDALTGLYNRRYYDKEFVKYFDSKSKPAVVVMADVNGLKLINDAFGHKEGDYLIRSFAEVLKEECSNIGDVVVRMGGDEFLILMFDISMKESVSRIQIIKEKFRNRSPYRVPFTASFGCVQKPEGQNNMEAIINRAESIMYRKKLSESTAMKKGIVGSVMDEVHSKVDQEKTHSDNVSRYSELLAKALGFSGEKVKEIKNAAYYHDIGKIRLDPKLLVKKSSLSSNEWEDLKRHSEVGYNILASIHNYSKLSPYILGHHERWDGTGYPLGLSGEKIPIEARIITIADAFDAMTSKRSYKEAITRASAIKELQKCAGSQFDPNLVPIFIKILIEEDMTNRQGSI